MPKRQDKFLELTEVSHQELTRPAVKKREEEKKKKIKKKRRKEKKRMIGNVGGIVGGINNEYGCMVA